MPVKPHIFDPILDGAGDARDRVRSSGRRGSSPSQIGAAPVGRVTPTGEPATRRRGADLRPAPVRSAEGSMLIASFGQKCAHSSQCLQ